VAAESTDEARLIELMIGYQKGSMDAFAALYAELSQPLSRYLWTFVRNRSTAEDLLQETFLQLHRARHTYTAPRPVRPWVYAITRHVALMYLRSTRRRKEYLPDEELPDIPVTPDVDQLGDRATVLRFLAKLPRAGQEVLILHHLLGLSFDEVGSILDLTTGAAKVRAHRALKSLRESIENREGAAS
jgi:RNA polymerase sigma-70 factor (ECF subfamily)